jgi:hypothetical protein
VEEAQGPVLTTGPCIAILMVPTESGDSDKWAPNHLPLVHYRIYRNGQLGLEAAYLVREPNGACWAYPTEHSVEKSPGDAGAIALDAKHLEEQPRQPDEPAVFLYRALLHVPPQPAVRMPPSLLGHFQGKGKPRGNRLLS